MSDIPKSFNLMNKDFVFSKETLDLAETCLTRLKHEEFHCNIISSKTTYVGCNTCQHRKGCSVFDGIEKKIEKFEFVLDHVEDGK